MTNGIGVDWVILLESFALLSDIMLTARLTSGIWTPFNEV
jgi:hypothetical protein